MFYGTLFLKKFSKYEYISILRIFQSVISLRIKWRFFSFFYMKNIVNIMEHLAFIWECSFNLLRAIFCFANNNIIAFLGWLRWIHKFYPFPKSLYLHCYDICIRFIMGGMVLTTFEHLWIVSDGQCSFCLQVIILGTVEFVSTQSQDCAHSSVWAARPSGEETAP